MLFCLLGFLFLFPILAGAIKGNGVCQFLLVCIILLCVYCYMTTPS